MNQPQVSPSASAQSSSFGRRLTCGCFILLAILLIAIGIAVTHDYQRRQKLLEYQTGHLQEGHYDLESRETIPQWLRSLIGEDRAAEFEPQIACDLRNVENADELSVANREASLQRLTIRTPGYMAEDYEIRDDDLRQIRNLPSLEFLDVGTVRLERDGLMALKGLSRLKTLRLHLAIGTTSLKGLDRVASLRTLQLEGGWDGENLQALPKGLLGHHNGCRIEKLVLDCSLDDEKELLPLLELPSLRHLTICDIRPAKVTDGLREPFRQRNVTIGNCDDDFEHR